MAKKVWDRNEDKVRESIMCTLYVLNGAHGTSNMENEKKIKPIALMFSLSLYLFGICSVSVSLCVYIILCTYTRTSTKGTQKCFI